MMPSPSLLAIYQFTRNVVLLQDSLATAWLLADDSESEPPPAIVASFDALKETVAILREKRGEYGEQLAITDSAITEALEAYTVQWGSEKHREAINRREGTDPEFEWDAMAPCQVLQFEGVRRLRETAADVFSGETGTHSLMAKLGTDVALLQSHSDLLPQLDESLGEGGVGRTYQLQVRRRLLRNFDDVLQMLVGLQCPESIRTISDSACGLIAVSVDEAVCACFRPPELEMPELLRPEDVGVFIGLNARTIRNWMKKYPVKLRHRKIEDAPAGQYMFDRVQLQFLREIERARKTATRK